MASEAMGESDSVRFLRVQGFSPSGTSEAITIIVRMRIVLVREECICSHLECFASQCLMYNYTSGAGDEESEEISHIRRTRRKEAGLGQLEYEDLQEGTARDHAT